MAVFDFKQELPQAFPKLDEKQIAAVAEFARCKTYSDGDVLFRAGETDFKSTSSSRVRLRSSTARAMNRGRF